jgi:hypothetical protein
VQDSQHAHQPSTSEREPVAAAQVLKAQQQCEPREEQGRAAEPQRPEHASMARRFTLEQRKGTRAPLLIRGCDRRRFAELDVREWNGTQDLFESALQRCHGSLRSSVI